MLYILGITKTLGKIKETIITTGPVLNSIKKLHEERSGEAHCHLALDLLIIQKEIQVILDTHTTPLVVGYLTASLSPVLLPLLELCLVRMQALTFPPFQEVRGQQGRKRRARAEDINIFINIYGDPAVRSRIGLFLSKNSLFLQHPKFPESGRPYLNPHILSRPGAAVHTTESTLTGGVTPVDNKNRDTEDEVSIRVASLSHVFDELCGSESQDEIYGDERYLKTSLLEHQRQGLYFLSMREQGRRYPSYQGNISSRGGILADYMGLGKTLTILSLIVNHLDEGRVPNSGNYLPPVHGGKIRSGATLIIAPVSVLGNWEGQIADHVKPKALRYFMYYGRNKLTDPQTLSQYDIVFTSFQTLTLEWKTAGNISSRGPLYAISWFRVVLDEAHEIRTQTTNKCQAACAISAERRWCVTGTPLQNDITDIATLFRFLNLEPFNTKQSFDRLITAKLKAGDDSGMKTLRNVLRQICLRRAKNKISDRLPARSENIKYLEFNSSERTLYDSHKQRLNPAINNANCNTFQVLLTLRLICDHGKDLLPQGDLEIRCKGCNVNIQLKGLETGGSGQIPCIHRAICQRCIAVTDRIGIFGSGCEECARNRENIRTAFPNYQGPSTKVQALVDSIKTCIPEDITLGSVSKHVVFSTWTRMLDLVGIALEDNSITFCRLDGSMSRLQRDNTLSEFSLNPHITVILVSLMAGGVGINLTCASKVHVLEPHWNPMVEQQAIERVHRLGQLRDVTITRYIMKDSFEIDMMSYQSRKLELARQSLDLQACPDTMEICASGADS